MRWLLFALLLIIIHAVRSALIPLSYDISLQLPLPDDSFRGQIVLQMTLSEPSSNITLNSDKLHSFRNISLISSKGVEPLLAAIKILPSKVEFRYKEVLPKGEYLLTIGEYLGKVSNGSTGLFYRKTGLLTTHLQPSYARRVFPCIDDPSVKAPFRLSVTHPRKTVCQSNTIATDVAVVDESWQRTVFAPTPALPAYLIAMSINNDDQLQLSRQTSFGVTVRVNARYHSDALRVLEIAVAAFELLADLIDIPLPLNKVDILLVPSYDGGMENWGHIALSESLADSGDAAHLTYVVAHELAHHWIGDRVTVDSWRWICLQEDLTDFVAYKIVRILMNNDKRYERFRLSKYVEMQLAEDFVSRGHPLVLPDRLTQEMIYTHCYLKGVVMLESIESHIGERAMIELIRNLLSSPSMNLNSFAAAFDKYEIMEKVTLAEVYKFWFTTGGFPSVMVDNAVNGTMISQISAPSSSPEATSQLWPLRVSSSARAPPFMLEESLSLPSAGSPLLVNLNFTSFMRVNYDDKTWRDVFTFMRSAPDQFSAVGRAQLVTDFCFFHARGQIRNSTEIKTAVIDMVYSLPEWFDLCEWNLYWCTSAADDGLLKNLVRRFVLNFGTLFHRESEFGCRNAGVYQNVNRVCQMLFGSVCI